MRVEKDAAWFNPDGNEVSDEAWNAGWTAAIALLLNGCTLQVSDEDGKWVIDDSFLLLMNAADQGVEFTLPRRRAVSPGGRSSIRRTSTIHLLDASVDAIGDRGRAGAEAAE